MNRQQTRKLSLIISLLLFPVTIYYFSPAVIINAGLEGIINGSFIVFGFMLVSAVLFGRWFCGYICPAGALQEILFSANNKIPKQGWKNAIKYIIWTIWISAVIFCYVKKGEITDIDFFYMTDHGVSVADIYGYIIYYVIILLIIVTALIGGKRTFCHYFCWMAPFMVIGTKIGRMLRLPVLHIAARGEGCISCAACRKACPMDVDIEAAAKQGKCTDTECIQCGACIDACPKEVLRYRMKNRRTGG
jgi:Polyferredoxin